MPAHSLQPETLETRDSRVDHDTSDESYPYTSLRPPPPSYQEPYHTREISGGEQRPDALPDIDMRNAILVRTVVEVRTSAVEDDERQDWVSEDAMQK